MGGFPMKRMMKPKIFSLLVLGLTVLFAGCLDFGKFSNAPVPVQIDVSYEDGTPVLGAEVTLDGPETYVETSGAGGVASFDAVLRGNYGLVVCAPDGSAARTHVPIWGGQPFAASVETKPFPNLTAQDINTGLGGSTEIECGQIRIKAGGNDIWGTNDGIHFAYAEVSGDVTLVARVAQIKPTHNDGWTKAGVMIRESLDANSKHASTLQTSGNGVQAVRRTSTGGESSDATHGGISAPTWVMIERKGDQFSSYRSADGANWTHMATVTIDMADTVYVGLALTAHGEADGIAEAVYDNISIILD